MGAPSTSAPPAGGADPQDPPRPADAVEVGRILGAWGVKGGIKVKPFSADPQALFSSRRWFVEPQGAAGLPPAVAAARAAVPRLLRITLAREQGELVVATCQELADRDAAQALAGAAVYIARSSFPTPCEDEFYWVDLIGLAVRNREGQELGTVGGLIETGPHCVLSVAAPGADEACLIPFVAAYVDRVDLAGRVIHVDWQADY